MSIMWTVALGLAVGRGHRPTGNARQKGAVRVYADGLYWELLAPLRPLFWDRRRDGIGRRDSTGLVAAVF